MIGAIYHADIVCIVWYGYHGIQYDTLGHVHSTLSTYNT